MGPGLNHIDPGEQPDLAKIHVRLSPTHNNVAGFPDYDGESDPRKVRLAIWVTTLPTFTIKDCHWLCLSDVTIRHGSKSLVIRDSVGVRLDHVDVAAGTSGILLRDTCDLTTITNCTVDGGLPPWYYRSDRKDGFHLPSDIDDEHPHAPGERTLDTLLAGPGTISTTTVKHCEFVNGHDMFTFGDQMTFSRNWIKNLDDDALVIDTKFSSVRIFENVVEQCATTISSGSKADPAGGTHIYRNLLDLRRPIARTRPRVYQKTDCDLGGKDRQTLTTAYLYKSTPPDGPLFFFQNTCIVKDVELAASFDLFRSAHIDAPRQAFNNIFVSVNSVVRSDKPIAYIPPPNPGTATDGNCFYRTGQYTAGPLIGHPEDHTHTTIDTLRELRGFPTVNDPGEPGDLPIAPNHYFTDSQAVYEPGFEASSIEGDPHFKRFRPLQSGASGVDDFRLRADSPARGAGVELVGEMATFDTAPHSDHPDMGFLPVDALPLAVGVDGRRLFPRPGPNLPGTGATHGRSIRPSCRRSVRSTRPACATIRSAAGCARPRQGSGSAPR